MAATERVSVKAAATSAAREEGRLRKQMADAAEKRLQKWSDASASDSFVNFMQKLGIGADNALTTGGYGFNPITRVRTQLEWMHRGTWIAGVLVDVVAEDMTKMGVEIQSDLEPDTLEEIEQAVTAKGIWQAVKSTIQWSRLFGGAIAVMLVDGQRMDTPLRMETIGKGQFRGLFVLDRWQVEPSLYDLVTDLGPALGLPKFYRVLDDSPALRGQKIHYSRVIRLIGIELPYYQRLIEMLWGESVLERPFDRIVAFDSATTGVAQLVYKAHVRTYSIDGLRDIITAGGKPLAGLLKQVEMMRRFMGIEGMTLLDAKDKYEQMGHTAFSGLADILLQFIQQLAGASQIPAVRLMGQSPAGLNATGDADIRMYFDNILGQQNKDLHVPMTTVYRAITQSEGIKLEGKKFRLKFRPLWQLSDKEKSDIAETDARAITAVEERNLISQAGAMKELKQSSTITGRFSNITPKDIADADDEIVPASEAALEETNAALGAGGAGDLGEKGKRKPGEQ